MIRDMHRTTSSSAWVVAALLATTLWLAPAPAAAQCAGDCNADNSVAIHELIVGVNIALGSQPTSTCPAFDSNGDGSVSIAELILAVNNALGGCNATPPTQTPTQVVTPPVTPTATPTGGGEPCPVTPTPTIPPLCGNGVGDQDVGETCDDGNTLDGDSCPSNCRIARCTSSGERVIVDVLWSSDVPELLLAGAQFFLNYPDGIVALPGFAAEPAVSERFSSDNFSASPNDLDYGVRALLLENSGAGSGPGTFVTIEFDACEGAALPTDCDFACTFEEGSDPNFNDVDPETVQCRIAVR